MQNFISLFSIIRNQQIMPQMDKSRNSRTLFRNIRAHFRRNSYRVEGHDLWGAEVGTGDFFFPKEDPLLRPI